MSDGQLASLEMTNVDTALRMAITDKHRDIASVNINFKVNPVHKEIAQQICKQHGVSLSDFMRATVECLCRDYVGDRLITKATADFLAETRDNEAK